MGHCTPKAMPDCPTGAVGTDLPAGDAPAPAAPGDWYADRLYPKAEMDRSRHAMMEENGGQTIAFLNFDLAEYQARKGRDGFRWGVAGGYGGAVDRLTPKSEGEGARGEGVEAAAPQFLYIRAGGPDFTPPPGVCPSRGAG